jgi:ribosome-associated protein
MDDTFQMDNTVENQPLMVYNTALELGKLLQDYRAKDVVVMDLRQLNFWTDFFVIATVTSHTHLQGLERHIKEFTREKGIVIQRHSPQPRVQNEAAPLVEDTWRLIDLGTIVIHLMSTKTRAFYELERLWSAATVIFQENPAAACP